MSNHRFFKELYVRDVARIASPGFSLNDRTMVLTPASTNRLRLHAMMGVIVVTYSEYWQYIQAAGQTKDLLRECKHAYTP